MVRSSAIFIFVILFFCTPIFTSESVPIRVVMDNNYPPYVFLDSKGQAHGLLIDIWKAWEQTTGQTVEIKAVDWSTALTLMDSGQADVIDTIFKTPERENRLAFSAPWVSIPVVVYVDARITGIVEPSLLGGFHIAVKKGDAAIEMLRNAGLQNFDEYPSYEAIINAALEHKVSVFCMDQPPARYFLYHYGLEKNFNEAIILSTGQFHRAVQKDQVALLKKLENGFSQIPKATLDKLDEIWLGHKLETQTIPPIAIGFIIASITLVLILIAWIFTLRRLVAKRTHELSTTVSNLQTALKSNVESENRFRSLVNESIDGIMLTDEAGIIRDWNHSMETLTGYTAEDITGKYIWDVQAQISSHLTEVDKMSKLLREKLEHIIHDGDSHLLRFNDEHVIYSKDGEYRWVQTSGFLVQGQSGWRFGSIFRDVTLQHRASSELEQIVQERTADLSKAKVELESLVHELRTTQKQLVESEKLAALGSMVAGIAHEVNTPLGNSFTMGTFITQKLEELHHQLIAKASTESMLPLFDEIKSGHRIQMDNLQRGTELIQTFKLVASDQSSDAIRNFNLRSYAEEVILTLHPQFKNTQHRIEVTGNSNIEISSIPGKIAQILTNLVVNSIRHGFENVQSGLIQLNLETEGRQVIMEYRDNGNGMAPEVLEHLWEPFFTTKRGHGGTGLGMNIIYNLVTQILHGTITCTSTTGNGVFFKITFPAKPGNQSNFIL